MTLKELKEVAREAGLKNPRLFSEFMKTRFPEEGDPNYIQEWVGRFGTGRPEGYMDSHSKAIYTKLKKVL